MGEAKRRKATGDYPAASDITAAERRNSGTLTITINVEGEPTRTDAFSCDPTQFAKPVPAKETRADRDLSNWFCGDDFADRPRAVAARGSVLDHSQLVWDALRHPEHGEQVNSVLRDELLRNGEAHFSFHFSWHELRLILANHVFSLHTRQEDAARQPHNFNRSVRRSSAADRSLGKSRIFANQPRPRRA